MAAISSWKGTIVRAHRRFQLAVTKTAFGALERFAPALGVRWAVRLWCTLPGNEGRRRDERPMPGEASTISLGEGRRIAVERWGFGPPVYLMHGWGGWRGQLGAFVTPLVDAGYRVIAVDAPSHGDSTPGVLGPGRGVGTEFAEALTAAAGKHGKPVAVIAHSFGCAAVAIAVHDGLPAARLVLIAPSTDLVSNIAVLARTLGFGDRIRTGVLNRLEQLADRPMSDFDTTALGRRSEMPPTLVVHDRDDKEVAYDEGAELASQWPEAELATTEGLGHQRILRDPGIVEMVVDYIATSDAAPPKMITSSG